MKKILHRKISSVMKIDKIKVCDTLSGLPVYSLLIRHKKAVRNELSFKPQAQTKQNKTMVIMSRQHPGETQGSFITEGFLEALL